MKPTRQLYPSSHTDAYLRRRFQRALSTIKPPAGEKRRLLQAAAAAEDAPPSRFNLWQAFIETQRYIPTHNLIHWSVTCRSSEGIFPVAKVFYPL